MQYKSIGFFGAYGALWKYYANFVSRTSREAFWKAFFVHSLIYLVMCLPLYYVFESIVERNDPLAGLWLLPLVVYSIATVVPTIAIIIRRLHDLDRHGCWFFLFLVPYAGPVMFFIMLSRQSAPFDVYPGRSGGGPYTGGGGAPPYGQQGTPYARAQQDPYAQPQNPYEPPYSEPQDPYSAAPMPQNAAPPEKDPYSSRYEPQQDRYAQPQKPYEPPYSEPQNPYAPPQEDLYSAAPPPQNAAPHFGQLYEQSRYAPPQYMPSSAYYGTPPPAYYRPLPPPRRFAPPAGGNKALAAIVLTIIVAVASNVYSFVCSDYIQKNIDRYIESLFSNAFLDLYSEYPEYGGIDPWGESNPWDGEPWGGNPWDNDEPWNDDPGYGRNGEGQLAEDELAAIGHVRDSALEGFPDFTIEEVLLTRVEEGSLEWDCFSDEVDGDAAYYVAASGFAIGDFVLVYAGFDVYSDGVIELYNLDDGDRDEYYKEARKLYGEWYEAMLSGVDKSTA